MRSYPLNTLKLLVIKQITLNKKETHIEYNREKLVTY